MLKSSRREFFSDMGVLSLVAFSAPLLHTQAASESVPQGPVIQDAGPWLLKRGCVSIILVADEQLETLVHDPDAKVNLSVSAEPDFHSLNEICKNAQYTEQKTLAVAYDEFWKQYREDLKGTKRQLFPDTERYIDLIGQLSRHAADFGLEMQLSFLTPLEIGENFIKKTGKGGRWVQFREAYRDPETGQFTANLWEHTLWLNNKGHLKIDRVKVQAFAFKEEDSTTPYRVVQESDIVELSGDLTLSNTPDEYHSLLIVSGSGNENPEGRDLTGFNRVMVVVTYQSREMDYFAPEAKPYLMNLVKRYYDAGIKLNSLYSDEIHIQQDGEYFTHHNAGQFNMRFLTDSFIQGFADQYGEKYRHFEKYLVYFLVGQHDFDYRSNRGGDVQHAMGAGEEGIRETWLLRRRYLDYLHKTVVDLFAGAKHYAEELYGKMLLADAHSTWAQSPTIDQWRKAETSSHYEYTPDFVWSNTIHQASAACDDYFAWGDFLTGSGNDHAEGGWSDRNYYGQAIACSTGSLNDIPNSYADSWGLPVQAQARHTIVGALYGNRTFTELRALEGGRHRIVDVLMLYPLSLVACEERFGSWMTLYGYANYATAAKVLQFGVIENGALNLRGYRYPTICALYEPILQPGELDFLQEFIQAGGRVVWSGPPAIIDLNGKPLFDQWLTIFGLKNAQRPESKRTLPGRRIEFEGILEGMEPMTILTDFPIDAVYPIEPLAETEVLARCDSQIVASRFGNAVYLGFRPRDDQSGSLGYETRVWFDTLHRLGAYPPTDPSRDDNPVVVSRTSPYLATHFQNGTIAVGKHYCHHKENWPGGYYRDKEQDEEILRANPLDSNDVRLSNFAVDGVVLDYEGMEIVALQVDEKKRPIAFYGKQCRSVTINGVVWNFASQTMPKIAWAPVAPERRVPDGALLEIWTEGGAQTISIPIDPAISHPRVYFQNGKLCGEEVEVQYENGVIQLAIPEGMVAFYLLDRA